MINKIIVEFKFDETYGDVANSLAFPDGDFRLIIVDYNNKVHQVPCSIISQTLFSDTREELKQEIQNIIKNACTDYSFLEKEKDTDKEELEDVVGRAINDITDKILNL